MYTLRYFVYLFIIISCMCVYICMLYLCPYSYMYMCNYVSVYNRYYRYIMIYLYTFTLYTPRVHAQEACFHTYERLRVLSRWAHLRFEKKHPQCLNQNPPRHEKRIERLGRETTKYIAKNY